jgi:hypothetical protein
VHAALPLARPCYWVMEHAAGAIARVVAKTLGLRHDEFDYRLLDPLPIVPGEE